MTGTVDSQAVDYQAVNSQVSRSTDPKKVAALKINPEKTISDHSPNNWRSSSSVGGNPGKSDETSFQLWMMENKMQDTSLDADRDGLTALTEYAIGTDPKKVSPESGFEIRLDELEIEELVQEFLIFYMKLSFLVITFYT